MATEDRKRKGTRADRRDPPPWVIWALIGTIILIIIGGVAVVVGLNAFSSYEQTISALKKQSSQVERNQVLIRKQQEELTELERIDRESSRAAAYRICQRDSVERAVIQFILGRSRDFRALVPLLQTKPGLPVLDCKPNLDGTGARLMKPARQARLVERWIYGLTNGRVGNGPRLSNEELGICPNSIIGKPGEADNCK